MLSIQHEPEKFFAEIGVPDRVEQNRIVLVAEMSDYRVRRGLQNGARLVAGSNLYRQRIVFSRTIEIACLDEPKLGGIGLGRNAGTLKNAHLPECASLGAEPATAGDVFG